jgi:hypothetical protein
VFLPLLNKMLPRMLDPRSRGGVALRCESATSGAILSITSGYNSLGLPTRMVDAHVCAKGRLGEFFWILASRYSARFFRSLEDLKNLRRLLLITYCKCKINRGTPPYTWDTSTLFVGADHSICGRKSPGLGDVIAPPVGGSRYRRLALCKGHRLMDKNRWSVWGLPAGHPICGMAREAQPSPGGTRHPVCGSERAIGAGRCLSTDNPICGRRPVLQVSSGGLNHPFWGTQGGQHPVCGNQRAIGAGRCLSVGNPICGRRPVLQVSSRGLNHPFWGTLSGQHPVCGSEKAIGAGRCLSVDNPICGRRLVLRVLSGGAEITPFGGRKVVSTPFVGGG